MHEKQIIDVYCQSCGRSFQAAATHNLESKRCPDCGGKLTTSKPSTSAKESGNTEAIAHAYNVANRNGPAKVESTFRIAVLALLFICVVLLGIQVWQIEVIHSVFQSFVDAASSRDLL